MTPSASLPMRVVMMFSNLRNPVVDRYNVNSSWSVERIWPIVPFAKWLAIRRPPKLTASFSSQDSASSASHSRRDGFLVAASSRAEVQITDSG